MKTRPFLSHRRADRAQVVALKQVLALYGVGGWRDLDDLHVGELAQPGFERAINDITGGLLWYGTKRVLSSWYVNNVELPTAIARKRREDNYPLVPLFVTVRPDEARAALLAASREPRATLTADDHKLFFDANGCARERAQSIGDFRTDVARRYVRSAVRWLNQDAYTVAITALTEPVGIQDFTFDWRRLVNPGTRELSGGAETTMRDAVLRFRDAIKPAAEFPQVTIDFDVPLPIAALVGYDWRVTSRLKLRIRQRTRSSITVVDGDGPAHNSWPAWTEERNEGGGGCVIAVATTGSSLAGPLAEYARAVGAARTFELHVPRELDAAGIRGLARYVAAKLRDVGRGNEQRHLLLAGPCALAALVGAAANAAGPVTVPFWNGSSYVSTITLGF
jgi:hypothetical protein